MKTTTTTMKNEPRIAYSYTRFSTPEQKHGDSARRQMEAAKRWCEENGYILSEQTFIDEGRSGFKGKNLTGEGQLKRFIDLVKAGKIPHGSVLILESFDRFSRLPVRQSVEHFLSVINAGIGMVFTMTYRKQLITGATLDEDNSIMYSIVGEAQRSTEESKHKRERVKEACDTRKQNAIQHGHKRLVWCPAWCDFKPTETVPGPKGKPITIGEYTVNEHKAAIVRRVYDEYLNGLGAYAICRKFNLEKVPTLGHGGFTNKEYKNKSTVWHKKAMRELLFDKRVYGYCHFIDTENFFPVIVSRDKFNQVQHRISVRSNLKEEKIINGKTRIVGVTGGRVEGVGSLFTGIIRCVHCGQVINKTHSRRQKNGDPYHYLVCAGGRMGTGCSLRGVPYELFENVFINGMKVFTQDFSTHLGSDDKTVTKIENRMDALRGELVTVKKQIEKLNKTFLELDNPPKSLVTKLSEFEARQTELERDIQLGDAQISVTKTAEPDDFIKMIAKVDTLIKTDEGRMKIREYLRQFINRIELDVKNTPKVNFHIYFKNGFVWSVNIHQEGWKQTRKVVFQFMPGVVTEIDWNLGVFQLNEKNVLEQIVTRGEERFKKMKGKDARKWDENDKKWYIKGMLDSMQHITEGRFDKE